jgi:hypothetical protein
MVVAFMQRDPCKRLELMHQLINVVKTSLNPHEEVARKVIRQIYIPVFTGLLHNIYYELEHITFTNKIAQAHILYFYHKILDFITFLTPCILDFLEIQ